MAGRGQARPAGNLYPAKQRPEQKIDAAVALMMAVGRAMAEDTGEGHLEGFLRHSRDHLTDCFGTELRCFGIPGL